MKKMLRVVEKHETIYDKLGLVGTEMANFTEEAWTTRAPNTVGQWHTDL
jgi:hypothetical protein